MLPKAINTSQILSGVMSLAVLMLAGTGCAGGAKNQSAADIQLRNAASQIQAYEQEDVFRKGDFLNIELNGVPSGEAGQFNVKVDESGNISMPHIGNIRAEGLNSVTLKEKIEIMYKMAQIYNSPNVSVTSQQARFVSISGEVRSPQRLYHAKDLTVLGAIATTGGFTDYADRRNVKLLRDGQVIVFDAVEMLEDPTKDIPLLPDDKIQVDRSIF